MRFAEVVIRQKNTMRYDNQQHAEQRRELMREQEKAAARYSEIFEGQCPINIWKINILYTFIAII